MSASTAPFLDPVDDGISSERRDEIRKLVDAKYLVDELARSGPAGRRLTRAFHDGAYGPRYGSEFLRTALPFSDLEFRGDAVGYQIDSEASSRW
ncbi:hypothetical protein [Burkholderia sp. Ac-20353]|uniref:hypothetical protein n=1 Tax=Burkholderia sp. Ac-20353 TaxID=2703894 RepID=UPI00197C11B4|nr:hypothetical protein [Burkholderia sp. Ac-20353]MBN3785567.1 hypothetical protein [Burkholderia sp. Ac-20353]